jgi:acyl-coenzyme A thioesterase PaaI-like protein
VHGGYILAAFDEVLGLAQDLGGQPGMTGTLTTKFRRPTPLHTDLRFVARIDRIEGRKTFTVGELYDPDGNLLAEADAVFITVDFEKLKALAEARDEKQPPS